MQIKCRKVMEFSSVQNLLGRNIVFPLFSDKQEITASISLMVKNHDDN